MWLWRRAQPTVRPRKVFETPGHLEQDLLAVDLGIGVAADDVAGAGAEEAGGDERVVVAREEFVAGDLLEKEAVVGLVGLEGLDDVVAVAPGLRAFGVEFVAVGVGVADDVEPFQGPAFAVGGRGE